MTAKPESEKFKIVQTSKGPRRIYKRNPEDIIYDFTPEGLASDFGRDKGSTAAKPVGGKPTT